MLFVSGFFPNKNLSMNASTSGYWFSRSIQCGWFPTIDTIAREGGTHTFQKTVVVCLFPYVPADRPKEVVGYKHLTYSQQQRVRI